MLRQTHSLPGLIAALLVAVLAVTGAILSLDPVLERAGTRLPKSGQVSVAALAEAVTATHGEVDRIVKTASGSVVVYYFDGDRAGADFVDPATGQTIGPYEPSGFIQFVTNLHRSFLMDDVGRAAAGIGALAMVVLAISGAIRAKRPAALVRFRLCCTERVIAWPVRSPTWSRRFWVAPPPTGKAVAAVLSGEGDP